MTNELKNRFEQKLLETLYPLKINNENYIASTIYGKSFIVCRCYGRLDYTTNLKLLKPNLRRHLRKYKCYEFEEIDEELGNYIATVEEMKQSSECLVPIRLETIFEEPESIEVVDGHLCLICHKLQTFNNRNKCCENRKQVKAKMLADKTLKGTQFVLKDIEEPLQSPAIIKYLKHAYGIEDFEDQVKQLEVENECHQASIAELRHETTMLKSKLAHLTTDTDFYTDHYIGPSLEEISKLIESGSNTFKNCPNPNEILSDKDFIISVLNFEKSISKAELFKMHKLPRGKLSSEENELRRVSIIIMKILNGKVDKSKGAVAARITGIGARTIDSTLHHFNSVTANTVVKYNQAATRPLLVYLYRTDNQFKQEIKDVIINWKDKELTEYTPRLIKAVLWNLIRILKNHSSFNPLFKFIQAMSIVSNSKYHVTQADFDEEDQEEEEYPQHNQDASSETDVTYCRSTTLNTLLSALKFLCFGCVLVNWNELSPLDSYLQHFKDGLIFSQLSTLLYQVQRKQEIRISEHHIELKFDTTTKKYKYLTPDGALSVTQFRDSYSTVLNKFKAWFSNFLSSFDGDADELEQLKLLLENLLDPFKACNKIDFQFSTSDDQPSLKGDGFKLMEAIAKNSLSSEELDLDAIITTVEHYKMLCLALIYFASGTNMRQFDVCRLFVSRYNVKQGSLQIGKEFGLFMNSSSIKATKTPSTFSLLFDRAQVLLAFGYIILTQEMSNLFIKKFKKDFRFINNQDFAKYEKDIVEKIFQQQHEPIYGSFLQERLGNNEILPPYLELAGNADVLKSTNISAKGKKLKLIFQDIFKNEGLSLSQLRQMFSCFNYDLGRLIENLDDLDMLPADLKERVARLDNDLKRQLDQAQLNSARGDVSGHQEGTRRVWYAGKYSGINALAEDVLQTSQNLDLKSIFFLDKSFIGNENSNSTQSSQTNTTTTTTSVPPDEENEDIPTFNQSDHDDDPSEYHYENNDIDADAKMNEDSGSYINPELTLSPTQALTNTTTTSTTTSTTSSTTSSQVTIAQTFTQPQIARLSLTKLNYNLTDIQQQIFNWYWEDTCDCVIRTGTGSGKTSLLILLTKLTPGKINIIMTPSLSLLDSIILTAKNFEVNVHRFDNQLPKTDIHIDDEGVLVVCCFEKVDNELFTNWVKDIKG